MHTHTHARTNITPEQTSDQTLTTTAAATTPPTTFAAAYNTNNNLFQAWQHTNARQYIAEEGVRKTKERR